MISQAAIEQRKEWEKEFAHLMPRLDVKSGMQIKESLKGIVRTRKPASSAAAKKAVRKTMGKGKGAKKD